MLLASAVASQGAITVGETMLVQDEHGYTLSTAQSNHTGTTLDSAAEDIGLIDLLFAIPEVAEAYLNLEDFIMYGKIGYEISSTSEIREGWHAEFAGTGVLQFTHNPGIPPSDFEPYAAGTSISGNYFASADLFNADEDGDLEYGLGFHGELGDVQRANVVSISTSGAKLGSTLEGRDGADTFKSDEPFPILAVYRTEFHENYIATAGIFTEPVGPVYRSGGAFMAPVIQTNHTGVTLDSAKEDIGLVDLLHSIPEVRKTYETPANLVASGEAVFLINNATDIRGWWARFNDEGVIEFTPRASADPDAYANELSISGYYVAHDILFNADADADREYNLAYYDDLTEVQKLNVIAVSTSGQRLGNTVAGYADGNTWSSDEPFPALAVYRTEFHEDYWNGLPISVAATGLVQDEEGFTITTLQSNDTGRTLDSAAEDIGFVDLVHAIPEVAVKYATNSDLLASNSVDYAGGDTENGSSSFDQSGILRFSFDAADGESAYATGSSISGNYFADKDLFNADQDEDLEYSLGFYDALNGHEKANVIATSISGTYLGGTIAGYAGDDAWESDEPFPTLAVYRTAFHDEYWNASPIILTPTQTTVGPAPYAGVAIIGDTVAAFSHDNRDDYDFNFSSHTHHERVGSKTTDAGAFSDMLYLLSDDDGTATLIDASTNRNVHATTESGYTVSLGGFTDPEGNLLAVLYNPGIGMVEVFDLETGIKNSAYDSRVLGKGYTGGTTNGGRSPESLEFLLTSPNGIATFDSDGILLAVFELASDYGTLTDAVFDPGANTLYVATRDGLEGNILKFEDFGTYFDDPQPPVFEPIGDRLVDEHHTLTFTASATDADTPVSELTYTLTDAPSGAIIDPKTGAFSWTPSEARGSGSYTFSVNVSDGEARDTESITVNVGEVNDSPVLSTIGDKIVYEHATLIFRAIASDGDLPEQTLRFALEDAPAGAMVNAETGAFSWNPGDHYGPGEYAFRLSVTDGELTDSEAISVRVDELNAPPSLEPVPDQYVAEMGTLRFPTGAVDFDYPSQELIFSLRSAPEGMVINPATGDVEWTPTEAQGPSSYTITLEVSDGRATNFQAFIIVVDELNTKPILAPIGDRSIEVGQELRFTASASDFDEPPQALTYSLTGAPNGASINEDTGAFAWTPTEAQTPGSYTFTVLVWDGYDSASENITVTVTRRIREDLATLWLEARLPSNTPTELRQLEADMDRDGFSNLAEYAMGGDPAIPDGASLMSIEVGSVDSTVSFLVRARAGDPALRLVCEIAQEPDKWTAVPLAFDQTSQTWTLATGELEIADARPVESANGIWVLTLQDTSDKEPVFLRIRVDYEL